jgi:hypothetical protein
MQILIMFLNYMLTLALVLLVLSGAWPLWSVAVLPLFVLLEYKDYRATLSAAEQAAPHAPASFVSPR